MYLCEKYFRNYDSSNKCKKQIDDSASRLHAIVVLLRSLEFVEFVKITDEDAPTESVSSLLLGGPVTKTPTLPSMEIICVDTSVLLDYYRSKQKSETTLYRLSLQYQLAVPTIVDILIAGTALVNRLKLATLNTKDFSRIPNLELIQE